MFGRTSLDLSKAWISQVALRSFQGAKGFDFHKASGIFLRRVQEFPSFGAIHRLLVSLSGLSATRRSLVHI